MYEGTKRKRVRNFSRFIQVLGILIGLGGVAGFWLTQDVQRTILSEEQADLINPNSEAFQASFVVAGRDYDYEPAGPMVWKDGKLQRSYTTEAELGFRTDTIIYVNIVGNDVYMVNIPRDLYLHDYDVGINGIYQYGPEIFGGMNRAEHVRRAVSELLGVPVDYYAVINIDIFEKLVDAVGGVDLDVPYRMYWQDQAGGLDIDLQPGFQHLNGEQASGFIRYRQTLRGDIDRIDNVKTLARAMLAKLKAQNVRAVGTLPKLVETYLEEVDTNVSPALVSKLVPRLPNLEIDAATLPINDVEGSGRYVETDRQRTEAFLADFFGGEARKLTQAPEASVRISNRSGVPSLAAEAKRILVGLGIPEEQLSVGEAPPVVSSQIVTTGRTLSAASYYADLTGLGVQQIDRFERSVDADIEVVLGQDAREFFYAQLAQAP